MQTEKSFAVEEDIVIAHPQGMLFWNISHVEGPVGSQNQNMTGESSDSNSIDVEENIISDVEAKEIPSEF